MKQWKIMIVALAAVVGIGAATLLPAVDSSAALKVFKPCDSAGVSADTAVCKGKDDKVDGLAKTITNLMFYFVGILAVIMIIAGGIRYVISTGDSSKVKAAKDTIMYSVVGLIVALLAWTIVSYVISKV